MADSRRYADWYNKAKSDLNGAIILYKNDGDLSLVAFHCQQAIEKMLKGYILKNTKKLLEGHSLVFLIRRASQFDVSMKDYLKDCAFVSQFYTETRYPSDLPNEVDGEEAKECLDTATAVVEYIDGQE
jgi:HEPN domain-containing protein